MTSACPSASSPKLSSVAALSKRVLLGHAKGSGGVEPLIERRTRGAAEEAVGNDMAETAR